MKKISIIGLTGNGKIGAYEKQLGNAAILIPMPALFRSYFPDVQICTTIQLTEEFCMKYGMIRLPAPRKISPRFVNIMFRLMRPPFDFVRSLMWRLLKNKIGLNLSFLIEGGIFKDLADSEVILDFNGDIFPTDSHPALVLMHVFEIAALSNIGIPIVGFISSPGPFKSPFHRLVSRFKFRYVSLFLNREPISSELMRQLGIQKPIVNTACPAFLLKPVATEVAREILINEGINLNGNPLVGITLCGYNLHSQRTWRKPHNFDDVDQYVPMLRYLLEKIGATVFLLPHVYRLNPYTVGAEHINGPDYDILLHLFKKANGEKYEGRLRLIDGKYSPAQAKGMIGQCDMFISGRLHAAVAAMSQGVPTVLLGYGHKHKGFARLLDQEEQVYFGRNSEELVSYIAKAWENRDNISEILLSRMVRVEELVKLNFEIIREIVTAGKENADAIINSKNET